MTPKPPTVWLTAKEAAEYARVSVWTIREAVKSGELEAYSVGKGGRTYTLDAAKVDAWRKSTPYEPGRTA